MSAGAQTVVIIPAYKPGSDLPGLARELLALEAGIRLLVVDDGSGVSFAELFGEVAALPGVTLLRHAVNQGKGQALKTAFNHVLLHMPDVAGVVTADADGQHLPADILGVANVLAGGRHGLVLGVRSFGRETPFRSRFGNVLTSGLSRFLFGRKFQDTQTGLRGIAAELLPECLRLRATGYDFEMEMLSEAVRLGVSIREVPIATVYLEGNRGSHFNPLRDSLAIYYVLLRHTGNSVLTAIIDWLAFSATYLICGAIFPSLVAGRVVAGSFNFFVGKAFVFRSRDDCRKELIKYFSLVVLLMCMSYFLIMGLVHLTAISPFIAKIIVEGSIFFLSFAMQRLFVFNAALGDVRGEDTWDEYTAERSARLGLTRRVTQARLLRLFRRLAPGRTASLTELGGADSCFYRGLRRAYPNALYTVADRNQPALDKFLTDNASGPVRAVRAELLREEAPAGADIVFSVGLVEQLDPADTARCVRAHFEAARPGGLVVMSYATPALPYRLIRKLAEFVGVWRFPAERPLRFQEVHAEASRHGELLARETNWLIGLTQELAAYRARA